MLIYDHPDDVTESTVRGARGRVLPVSTWFIRAAHAFVAAITAPGPNGALYAVDMRLRPSGRKGPVAVSLAAFRNYPPRQCLDLGAHGADAGAGGGGTAGVGGDGARRDRRRAASRARLCDDPPRRRRHARARLARDLPPTGPWDVKLRVGGQMEVEFVAQALLLCHVAAHPGLASPTTRTVLRRLHASGLLEEADAALLTRADRAWRSVQGLLRITVGRTVGPELPEPALRALLPVVEALDLAALRATLDALAEQVRAVFFATGWRALTVTYGGDEVDGIAGR